MSSWMPLEELREMTRAVHVRKVCRALTQMGIAYKLDCEGSPVVSRAAVARVMGEEQTTKADEDIDIDARLKRLGGSNGKKATARRGTSA